MKKNYRNTVNKFVGYKFSKTFIITITTRIKNKKMLILKWKALKIHAD